MITISNLIIPETFLKEVKGLGNDSIKSLLASLINYLTDKYIEKYEACNNTSREFDSWIDSLTKNEVISLCHYVLSILDYLT